MSVVSIKRNDTRPLEMKLTANKQPVNVEGAEIVFHMRPKVAGYGKTITDKPVAILDGVKGHVQVEWEPEDVEVSGVHRAEFEAQFADGTIETFPNDDYLDVEILSDLG